MKYFVIGYNKTATTTIHSIFSKSGIKCIHNYRNWENIINNFDCFSDNGNLENFKNLDKICPNSTFILNVRNLDSWIISRLNHGHREYLKTNKTNWAYPVGINDIKTWILDREKYHLEVLEYFLNNPKKLIIVNIEKRNWINFLFNNLNIKFNKVENYNTHAPTDRNNEYFRITEEILNSYNYNNKNKLIIQNNVLLENYLKIYKNNI